MNAVSAYNFLRESRDRAFSLAMRSSFESLGARSRLSLPIQLVGAERMSIGSRVYLGPGCWLLTHGPEGSEQLADEGIQHGGQGGHLEIGDGTSVAGHCVFSAAASVRIGQRVLFARNVYMADHRHGFEQPDMAILDQPLKDIRPIVVEDGAWLGQNAVILPGVTIGRGAVVGANSVVRGDVPPRSIAVGVPARVVRQLPEE